jgi:uncharacterized protein YqeY
MSDAAELMRARLSRDLVSAMKSRDSIATAALRSLIAALDNASAIPMSAAHVRVLGRSGDVPRKILSATECEDILGKEAQTRRVGASEYENLGRHEEAARLRAELAVIGRYVSGFGT